MEDALNLPSCHDDWNAYLDWMKDFRWIADERITIIFKNDSAMLKNDSKTKELVLRTFKMIILPFWEEEVKHVAVGSKPKKFQVYLVD